MFGWSPWIIANRPFVDSHHLPEVAKSPKMSTKFAKTTIGLARHQKSAVYYYSPKYTIGSAFRRAEPLGEYLLGT